MAATTSQPKAIAPAAFETELVKMDAGVQQSLPAGVSITINGTAMKQGVIDTTLQGWITTFKAVDAAKEAYKEAVAARLAITVEARTFYKALKAALKTYFGSQSSVLATFGISADKPVSTSTRTKMVAAAKRTQTRTIRGTKSKKAAAAITVVGEPAVSIPSEGKVGVGAPPLNLPAGTTAAVSTVTNTTTVSTTSTTPAPAGSGSGTTPASGTPAAGA